MIERSKKKKTKEYKWIIKLCWKEVNKIDVEECKKPGKKYEQ